MAMKFWTGFLLCLLLVDLTGAASIDVEKGTDFSRLFAHTLYLV